MAEQQFLPFADEKFVRGLVKAGDELSSGFRQGSIFIGDIHRGSFTPKVRAFHRNDPEFFSRFDLVELDQMILRFVSLDDPDGFGRRVVVSF